MAVVPIASTAPTSAVLAAWPLSVKVDNLNLAGAAQTVTVPAGVSFFLIWVTALVYLRVGGTATVPGAAATQDGSNDGSGSIPITPETNGLRPFSTQGLPSFSMTGTAIVAIQWFRDHRTVALAPI